MAITREDVLHVARLARLEIPEGEVDRVRDELGAILEAVGKVAELDLSDVEPTSHPLAVVNVWAEDEPRPSLSPGGCARQRAGSRGRGVPRPGGRVVNPLPFPGVLRATCALFRVSVKAGGGVGWPQGVAR